MFCKWCGLESDTTDVCSWCRKPFSSPSANTPQQPPSGMKAEAPARPAPEIGNFDDDLPPPPAAFKPIVIDDEPPAPASPPAAASSTPGGGMPMGDSFDDIDDDLSPFPFGGSGYKPAPLPPRSSAAPPPPTFTPPAQKASTPPPVFNPPPAAPVQARPQQPVAETTPPPPVFTAPPVAPVTARTEPAVEPVEAPAPPVQQTVAPPIETAPPPAPEPKPEPPKPVPGGMPAYVAPSLPVQADAKPSLEAIPIKLKGPGGAKPTPPPATPVRPNVAPGNRPSLPLSSPGGAPPLPSGTTPPPPTYRPVPPAPPAQPLASAAAPPAQPLARGPVPLGDVPEEDIPAGPIDLGLKPLVPDEDGESTPYQVPGRRLDVSASAPPTPPPSVPRTGLSAAPPPPSSRGGRTYYCRWCGMDSDDPQFCSWCKKDIRNAPNNAGKAAHVTVTHGPSKGKPVRQPARPQEQPKGKGQDKNRDKGPKQPLPDLLKEAEKQNKANGNGLPKAAPTIGTFQAAKSKYYSEQVYDPVSGAHYDADTGRTTDTPVQPRETVETNDFVQLGIYAGVFVVLLGLVYWAGSIFGTSTGGYFLVLGVAGFIAGILLPVLRVAPFPKDDGEDIGWAMGLIPLFGPFAGTMGYGVLGVVRQDVNPGVLGVFITSLLIRCVLDMATGHSLSKLVPFSEMSAIVLVAQVMPFVNLVGWLCSEVFHKPDE